MDGLDYPQESHMITVREDGTFMVRKADTGEIDNPIGPALAVWNHGEGKVMHGWIVDGVELPPPGFDWPKGTHSVRLSSEGVYEVVNRKTGRVENPEGAASVKVDSVRVGSGKGAEAAAVAV